MTAFSLTKIDAHPTNDFGKQSYLFSNNIQRKNHEEVKGTVISDHAYKENTRHLPAAFKSSLRVCVGVFFHGEMGFGKGKGRGGS